MKKETEIQRIKFCKIKIKGGWRGKRDFSIPYMWFQRNKKDGGSTFSESGVSRLSC